MEQPARILLIDDDSGSRDGLAILLRQDGSHVDAVDAGEVAFGLLEKHHYDVIITDLFLPGINGIEILKQVKEMSLTCNVILITGHATAETAVEAMKQGAFDYITKPLNFAKLKILVAKAVEKSRLVAENLYLRQQLRGKYKFDNIVGSSPAMQPVFTRMEKILHTDSTILILGESGTGKELVARAIHFNGARKDKPFIAINCGAIPAELLESELFGHMRGSFTGAVADKPGKFELAHQGTIFLDEIGTMPMPLQMKLLRVLQESELERVGATKRIKLDVRLISATNADLDHLVAQRQFREDLYYRLNVIPILLPPLRERLEDIPLLTKHFLRKVCDTMRRPTMNMAPQALRALEAYSWPGNVREMENVIERAVALSEGEVIDCADLPDKIGGRRPHNGPMSVSRLPEEGIDLPATVEEFERSLISQALQRTAGVKSRAATLLRLNRTTLVEKMKRYRMR